MDNHSKLHFLWITHSWPTNIDEYPELNDANPGNRSLAGGHGALGR